MSRTETSVMLMVLEAGMQAVAQKYQTFSFDDYHRALGHMQGVIPMRTEAEYRKERGLKDAIKAGKVIILSDAVDALIKKELLRC